MNNEQTVVVSEPIVEVKAELPANKAIRQIIPMAEALLACAKGSDAAGALLKAREIVAEVEKELNVSHATGPDDIESFSVRTDRARRFEKKFERPTFTTQPSLATPPNYEGIA